ncbi:hypothetical protein JCM5353_002017 [Sporobolomyces roseus]
MISHTVASHREPFISLSRIFLAVGITPIEGLLRYKLERPTYDCTLGGIAPFYDIWVSLRTAREVAEELEVLDELAGLLEWEGRKAWSVEDKEEGGMLENRIGSNSTSRILDPTDALVCTFYPVSNSGLGLTQSLTLSTPFPRLHLLPSGSQVRTLLPPSSTFQTFGSPSDPTSDIDSSPRSSLPFTYDSLWSKIVEWSVSEYENWLESPETPEPLTSASPSSSPPLSAPIVTLTDPAEEDASLTPLFLFSTILPLLTLTDALPPSTSNPRSSSSQLIHLPDILLSRSDLLPTSERRLLEDSTRLKASLYLVDAVSRFALADSLKLELEQLRRRIEAIEGTKERQKDIDSDRASPPFQKAKDAGATSEARIQPWTRGRDWLVFVALGLGLFVGYSFAKHVAI